MHEQRLYKPITGSTSDETSCIEGCAGILNSFRCEIRKRLEGCSLQLGSRIPNLALCNLYRRAQTNVFHDDVAMMADWHSLQQQQQQATQIICIFPLITNSGCLSLLMCDISFLFSTSRLFVSNLWSRGWVFLLVFSSALRWQIRPTPTTSSHNTLLDHGANHFRRRRPENE